MELDKKIKRMDKRTAVVTGGSRNIGFAIADKFYKLGYNVAILSVTEIGNSAKKAAERIDDTGTRVIGITCDVTDELSVEQALQKANSFFGGIDIVVNSAGILDMSSIEEMSIEHWDRVLAINLRGTFTTIQKSIQYLEKSNAPRVINISSNAGRMGGFENGLAYSASKGAIIALTYGLARRLGNKKITVNCIAPGTIESDMSAARSPEVLEKLRQRFPLGRFGTPEEVAAAVCYFASEEAGFTTGSVLDVNGGLFMG
ncbi:SDR family NAD(P)-dependent oxidoreductase [Arenibacter troitsensis]|uniref:3-oxoacyl-[acyl-carrier protein] reductase n=1 Tax=Arenibacter troitsensis TaxID=188872 RepID=A0A1X7J0W4_9FLAO|nr:3-oxoacyl-ACP reductase family protein [Arenibacter troitsensis]SMG20398.1 3-oxoacyl-[acyl-carrier protein] reductase [Arenibacter troitsensis]